MSIASPLGSLLDLQVRLGVLDGAAAAVPRPGAPPMAEPIYDSVEQFRHLTPPPFSPEREYARPRAGVSDWE